MIYPWQITQWQFFSQQRQQQRLPHAILLEGVEGLGKRTFADQIVATLLCEDEGVSEPCGQCHSCQLFMAESHPDHIVIAPEDQGKQIKIEQIRRLKEKQQLTPTVAKWKTVIVCPADNMNINSNNSLLKLLEEPQDNTLIILITAKSEHLPITILSRCQKIVLSSPKPDETINWVQQQGAFDAEVIEQLLPLANGAPLAVIKMLDSDTLPQIQQIEADFKSLLYRQVNPVMMAKDWQQYDLNMVFNHLQNLVKKNIIIVLKQNNTQSTKRSWHIYDCIIVVIKLLSSSNNINKTLLIEQFMVSVMDKNLINNSTNNGSI